MTATILVIDDSEDDQLLYQCALKDFDGILEMALTAEAGFARIVGTDSSGYVNNPDLILLDFNLPGMDGLGFMRRLAEHTDCTIPIVMLTGEDCAKVAVEAMKHGADDYLVKDIEGRYLRLLPSVVARAIGARTQREQTRRLLRRNQALMQNAMDGIHVMDMQGNIVEANDAFCQMLGYTQEEVARLNVADWDAQWSVEELRERFKQLVDKSARFETVHRRKDGMLIDVEVSTTGMTIDGQFFLYAASRDITERKQAEEDIKLSAQLMNSTSDSVFLIDTEGNFVYLNEAAWKTRGYTRDEMMAMKLGELNTPKFRALIVSRIKEVLEKGQGRYESAHYCKDGSVMPVEVSTRVIEFGRRKLLLASIRDISERKRVEVALKLNKTIIESAYDGFWMYDTNGYLLEVNQAYADMIGYAREELVGMHISRLSVQSTTPERVKARIEQAIGSGPGHFETQHRRKDGRVVDFDASIAYIPDANCLFSFIRDITERKEAEATLMQHKMVIDTSIDGFWVNDMLGNLREANEAYARMSGYTVEELVTMHISQLEAKEQAEDVKAHLAKIEAQGYDRFETRHRHKDGHEFDIEISATYMAEPPQLVVFCRDITERKCQDKEINQARMELQDLYDRAPCGYHSLDADGRIVRINQTEADWLGYERAELIGRKIQEFQTPSSLLTFAKNYPAFKENGFVENIEYELVRKDGSTFFILLSATTVKDADGNFIVSRSSMIDITERKKAEAALLNNEANMRAMLDNSPYLTWLKDTQGRYITINKVFADYLRLEDVAQVTGKTDFDLQPKELAEKYRADDAEVMAIRRQKHVEESAFDGNQTHWVETFKTPIIDTHGEVLGTVGFARNITERKRMQMETETLLRRNQTLMKTSMDGIHVLDMEGKVVDVNDAFCHMLGYSREEAMHLGVADWAMEFSREELRKRFRDHIGKSLMIETVHRRKDGTLINVEISITGDVIDGKGLLFCSSRDITERKKAEAELLQESVIERKRAEELAQQFGHLLQGSFNEIYLFDADSLFFLLTSEGAEKNLGYSDEELRQLTPLDLTPAHTHESFESLLDPLRSDGQQSLFFDTVHQRKDGTSYPVEMRLQLMRVEPPVFLAVVQDITERKQAYDLLHSSYAEIEDIYNHAPCGYHSLGKDGGILMINDTELAWLGYAREEVVGKMNWSDLITPASQPVFRESFSRFKKQGFIRDLEIELMRKDGTTLVGLVNATVIYDSNGDYVMSRSTVVDITSRKQAESELARQKEFTWQVIDTDPNLIYVKDAAGKFLMVNQALANFYGMSARQMIGKSDAMMSRGRKGLVGYLEPDAGSFKDGNEVIRSESSLTVDGEQCWYLTIKKPLPQADGSFNVLGIAVDITGQKLSEMKLAESYNELQRLAAYLENVREEERTRIARELHDEMGATLAALKMRAAWMASKLPPELSLLVEETGHISRLVSDGIYTLRHIVSELRPITLEDVGLDAAIENYVGKFMQNTGVECVLVLPDDGLALENELSAAIFRILQESLNNVAKHAQANKVGIRIAREGGSLLMVVEDDGLGFVPEPREKTFGLIGIRERALMVGGKASVSSVPGEGTRVLVSVPEPCFKQSIKRDTVN